MFTIEGYESFSRVIKLTVSKEKVPKVARQVRSDNETFVRLQS